MCEHYITCNILNKKFIVNNTTEEETVGLLSNIYNMNDPNDLLLIARAAKDCGAANLARSIVGMIKT